MSILFKRLTESDLPLLVEWLQRPHVAERWDDRRSLEDVREDYLPLLEATSPDKAYVAYLDETPIAFIQSYVAMNSGDGWWPGERDPGVRGIDLFLADADRLGQGLGTRVIRAFVHHQFSDPDVTAIQADPAPDNGRAIRCYEKAGFTRVDIVATPDGPALLMTTARPDRDR